jgi:hypothetical protein
VPSSQLGNLPTLLHKWFVYRSFWDLPNFKQDSRFLEPENDDLQTDDYKQTTLKNPDIVNYYMKGAAQSSSEA